MTVLDGASNAFATVAVCLGTGSLAINDTTNRVYVTCPLEKTIVAFDGATQSITSIPTGSDTNPRDLVVNRTNNKVYALNNFSMTILDAGSNTVVTVPTGDFPPTLVVNEATSKVYVADQHQGRVRVFDGATNASGLLQVLQHSRSNGCGFEEEQDLRPLLVRVWRSRHQWDSGCRRHEHGPDTHCSCATARWQGRRPL